MTILSQPMLGRWYDDLVIGIPGVGKKVVNILLGGIG
jgi:hypothetical protein